MSKPVSVSVIMSVYNAAKTLPACLASLKDQTMPHELILVDDGSTDGSANHITYPRLQIIKSNHQGPANARNQGVQQAQGEFLVFVDADMTFAPDFLEKLIAPIQSNQTNGTFTKAEYVANFDHPLARAWNYEYTHQNSKSRFPSVYPDEAPVFRAIRASEFRKVGGFDAIGYNDDWTLSEKLHYSATAVHDAVLYHANPDSWLSIWNQARWVAKRRYKWGEIGRFIALIRASLPFSSINAVRGTISINNSLYFPFKIWYDTAIIFGIIQYWLTGNHAK